MLSEILNVNVFAFLLIFCRTGTVFMLAPGFSSQQVSPMIRLLFAVAVAFMLTPVLAPKLPAMPGSPWMLGILILGEIVAGGVLATVARILIASVQVAGTTISFVSAMANALIYDPIAEQQSALVSGFLGTLAIVLMFVTDMHHLLIGAMIDSYTLFVPGQPPMAGDLAALITRHVALTFKVGVQMAAPFLLVAFSYYLGLGLLTRLVPQLPIFLVGLPLQIVLSITTFTIVVSSIALAFLSHFQEGLMPFLTP